MKTKTHYGKLFAACFLTAMGCFFNAQLHADTAQFFDEGLLLNDTDVMVTCVREDASVVNAVDPSTGLVPLAYIASLMNPVELAQWLVHNGADVNAVGQPRDRSPLNQASLRSLALVNFLIEQGAIVDLETVTLAETGARARGATHDQIEIARVLRAAYNRQNPPVVQMAQPVRIQPALQPGQLDRALGRRLQQLVNPPPPSAWFSVGASF